MERRRLKVIYYTKKKRQLKPPGESRGNPLRNYIEKEENVTRKVNMKTRACFFTKKHTSERQRRTRRSSSWWSQSAKRSLRDFSLFFPEWRLSDVSWRIFMMRWLISSRLPDSVPSLSVPVLSSGVSNGLDSGTNQAIHSLCPLLSLSLSLSLSVESKNDWSETCLLRPSAQDSDIHPSFPSPPFTSIQWICPIQSCLRVLFFNLSSSCLPSSIVDDSNSECCCWKKSTRATHAIEVLFQNPLLIFNDEWNLQLHLLMILSEESFRLKFALCHFSDDDSGWKVLMTLYPDSR